MKYSTQNEAIPSKINKMSPVLSVNDVLNSPYHSEEVFIENDTSVDEVFNASTVLQEETNFVEDFVLFDRVIEKIDSLQKDVYGNIGNANRWDDNRWDDNRWDDNRWDD